MKYEKADLWIGIVDRGRRRRRADGRHRRRVRRHRRGRHFTDSAGLARGIAAYAGHVAGALFAVALLDASIIGAFAVSLSSAYAIGDVLGMKHSLHRGVGQAKGFYALYAALICGAAAIVLIPGSPLGLITEGVQVLAGVLLPAATVFLLMLCNDKAVLGPWVNTAKTNAFTGGGDRGADHAVGRADRLGDVPGDHRHARSSRSWRAARPWRWRPSAGWRLGGMPAASGAAGGRGPSDAG